MNTEQWDNLQRLVVRDTKAANERVLRKVAGARLEASFSTAPATAAPDGAELRPDGSASSGSSGTEQEPPPPAASA